MPAIFFHLSKETHVEVDRFLNLFERLVVSYERREPQEFEIGIHDFVSPFSDNLNHDQCLRCGVTREEHGRTGVM